MSTKLEVMTAAATGEGCLGRSADDEPVFVLCARDQLAVKHVIEWALAAIEAGVNDDKVMGALRTAADMSIWRKAHGGGKVPD